MEPPKARRAPMPSSERDRVDIAARQSGLGFHLHNGRTTNAFCINSGDLMAAAETRRGGGGAAWWRPCHYTVMTSAANLTKVVFRRERATRRSIRGGLWPIKFIKRDNNFKVDRGLMFELLWI